MEATVPDHQLSLAEEWATTFKVLSDPTRLKLLICLHYRAPGAATVTEMARETDLRLATASAALQYLAHASVVRAQRDGRHMRYFLVDERVHQLVHHLGGGHGRDAAHQLAQQQEPHSHGPDAAQRREQN